MSALVPQAHWRQNLPQSLSRLSLRETSYRPNRIWYPGNSIIFGRRLIAPVPLVPNVDGRVKDPAQAPTSCYLTWGCQPRDQRHRFLANLVAENFSLAISRKPVNQPS